MNITEYISCSFMHGNWHLGTDAIHSDYVKNNSAQFDVYFCMCLWMLCMRAGQISRTERPFLLLLRTQAILEDGCSISIINVSHCSACSHNSFLELMDPKKLACTVSPYLYSDWPHPFLSDSLRHDQWLNPATDERLLPLVWVREWIR